jgi:hypothetical protein
MTSRRDTSATAKALDKNTVVESEAPGNNQDFAGEPLRFCPSTVIAGGTVTRHERRHVCREQQVYGETSGMEAF